MRHHRQRLDQRRVRAYRLPAALAAVLAAGSTAACESAPDEPIGPERPRRELTAKAVEWTVPPTWNIDRTAKSGTHRARYSIPSSGHAKHDAELLVSKLGGGSKADVQAELDDFLTQFEGPGVKRAQRDSFSVGTFEVAIVEVAATYKWPMGPRVGARKKAAAHVIKEDWRGIAAGVRTKDRGNWFFRLVGPNDTVEAARSAFHDMLKSLR